MKGDGLALDGRLYVKIWAMFGIWMEAYCDLREGVYRLGLGQRCEGS